MPFFLLYFRLARLGREHIPSSGPVLLAANHRSFLDPFVIGALTRRPIYYMAKRELSSIAGRLGCSTVLGPSPSIVDAVTSRRWPLLVRYSNGVTVS